MPISSRADETALKQQHRAYTGYSFGDGTIQTLKYKERGAKRDGKPVFESTIVRAGLAFRENTHGVKQNIDTSQGFTGKVFWYSDQNGFTGPVADASTGNIYAKDLLQTDAIAALPWTYRGSATEDGIKVAVVRATLTDGLNIDLHVDTADGAYHRMIIDPGGDYEERVRILKYSEIAPGVRVISSWQTADDDPTTVVDSDFQKNPLVADAELHPPPQKATWDFGATGVVPFTSRHNRIIVRAVVNGVPGTFLLDSGAADIFISGNFARRAGLKPIGHSEAYSLYGSQKTDIGTISSFTLGDSTLHNVTVNYGTAEFDTDGSDGLLGYGLFGGADITIDFRNNTLTLRDPALAAAASSPDGTHVKASFGSGQAMIPMVLDKSILFDAVIDTGDPSLVVIPSDQLVRHGLRFYAGSGLDQCGHIDTLSIGTISYDHPRACQAWGDGRWLLVGMDFLKEFDRVDFDYPNGELVFYQKSK